MILKKTLDKMCSLFKQSIKKLIMNCRSIIHIAKKAHVFNVHAAQVFYTDMHSVQLYIFMYLFMHVCNIHVHMPS